jgi:hypothetical protein
MDFPTPLTFAGLDLEDPDSVPEIPPDMTVSFSANGIGPIPLDLEGIDLDPLLGGIAPGARDDARPSAPPPPGRNPRLDRSQ